MISPDLPYARPLLALILIALLALLVWRAVRKDRREYSKFKRFRSSRRRQRMYRKWLLDSLGFLGGSAVVVLTSVWQFVPLLRESIDAYPVVRGIRNLLGGNGGLGSGIVVGVTVVLLAGSVLAIFAARHAEAVPAIGDIQALLPRNRAELKWAAALSINAGVVEELLFRLAVPALVFGVVGNALVAVLVSLALFGALHIYQGVAGIIGSTVIGALLMAVYVGTGSIIGAIVVHAFIDLRSLVLIPVIVQGVHRRPGSYSKPVGATALPAAEQEAPPL